MKKILQWSLLGILLTGTVSVGNSAHAQARGFSGLPPQDDPGAYLSREQYNSWFMREQPFMTNVVTKKDLKGEDQPAIIIQNGVLPPTNNVRGVITTPGGTTIIGPQP